jgi:predicted DNA-binding transcriptional regulator AlpA
MSEEPSFFIHEDECRRLSCLDNSSRYRLEESGDFPKRVKIGTKSVNGKTGWVRSEVMEWLAQRLAARDQPKHYRPLKQGATA